MHSLLMVLAGLTLFNLFLHVPSGSCINADSSGYITIKEIQHAAKCRLTFRQQLYLPKRLREMEEATMPCQWWLRKQKDYWLLAELGHCATVRRLERN